MAADSRRVWLGRRLLDDETALIAAGFVAVSHPLIAYSANARGYTLVALFAVVGFLAATRLSEVPSLSGWSVLVCASILGFFTLPVMLYGYAVISFWLIASATKERRRPLLYELVVASAVVAVLQRPVLYLPSAVRCGISNIISNQFVRPLALLDFLGGLAQVLAGELVGYRPGGLPPAAGMAMAAAGGSVVFWIRSARAPFSPCAGGRIADDPADHRAAARAAVCAGFPGCVAHLPRAGGGQACGG